MSSSTVFTPISIDASTLINFYSARNGAAAAAAAASTTTAKAAGAAPTAPWSTGVTTATLTAAATKVLNGGAFVDPSAAKLDVKTTDTDYKNLFALYGGLTALEGLAQSAQSTTLSAADRLRLQSKFAQGLAQVQSFVAGSPFKGVTVTNSAAAASVTATTGVKAEIDSYVTRPLATGASTDPDAALAGGGRFSAVITRGAQSTTVDFDLSDLGDNPSVADVAQYLNAKLQAAGALTRVSVALTPGAAQTTTAGGKTFSLGTGPTQVSLSVDGSSLEGISFQPAPDDAKPAAYVVQTASSGSGSGSGSVSGLTLSKFDPSGTAAPLFTQALPAGVTDVKASATGPDGSVYLLADVSGTVDGQAVKGSGDVALLRYDSTGALTYTRTLGAASQASAYALSVSPDGSRVAVAGAVTGALEGTQDADPSAADSVVTVYDAAQGVEDWTTRTDGAGDNHPASLAWGADGSVYVAGDTDAGLPGVAAAAGSGTGSGADAYVQGFSPTGARTFATVYGGAGASAASGLVVTSDGSLVTAGVQNGHAVLNRFDPPFATGAAPSATRDLGDLGGGSVTGLGLNADGSLTVAGVASGGLDLGTTTAAYGGGREVFAAHLSADLAPGPGDAGAWWTPPAGQDPTAAAAVVSGGQVYITGQTAGSAGSTTAAAASSTASTTSAAPAPSTGFAVALDPLTGAADWSKTLTSQDGTDAPAAIAVDPAGLSALDKLGLPSGALTFAGAADLVSGTSLRPGDSFKLGVGSATPLTVTVAAGDTLATLAARITSGTGGRAVATVVPSDGYEQLQIAPASSTTTLKLSAGPAGADALGALGLQPTLITKAQSTTKAPTAAPYALALTGSYSLGDAASAKTAFQALAVAVTAVRKAYTDLTTPAPTPGVTGGTVPAYLTAQIANYQLALERLTGSS